MYMCYWVTSLCYTAEINSTLEINYTSIKKKNTLLPHQKKDKNKMNAREYGDFCMQGWTWQLLWQ